MIDGCDLHECASAGAAVPGKHPCPFACAARAPMMDIVRQCRGHGGEIEPSAKGAKRFGRERAFAEVVSIKHGDGSKLQRYADVLFRVQQFVARRLW